MADLAIATGDFDRGYELASRARDEYLRSNASPALLSSIETGLGNIEQNREKCGAAIPHYERALAAAHEAGQKGADLAISYSNLASCLVDVGKRDAEARNALEGALAAWKDAGGDRPERAHAMATLADLEARAGRYAKAIELGQQAIAALNGLVGEPWQAIRDHVNDAMKQWRRGKHE
jgi:tetratricopeptide (TPR) repeat protein